MSFAAGKIKKVLNSDICSELEGNDLIKSNFTSRDLLRSRHGSFWKTNAIATPTINSFDSGSVAFSADSISSSFSEENYGSLKEIFILQSNKNLFKLSTGNILELHSTYNPEYWRKFISDISPNSVVPRNINNPVNASPTPQIIIDGSTTQTNNNLIPSAQNSNTSIPTLGNSPTSVPQNLTNAPTDINRQINLNSTSLNESGLAIPTAGSIGLNPPQNIGAIIEPTIKENLNYYDFAFDLSLPFSKKELSLLQSDFGTKFIEIKPTYNFFIENYELISSNEAVQESLLPSPYIFKSDGLNSENMIFKNHITLNNNIPEVYSDVINVSGEKINKSDKGEYYDKYSFTLGNLLRMNPGQLNALAAKFSNILIPSTNLDFIFEANRKKELFPMAVEINFSTDQFVQFAETLFETKLFSLLMKDIEEGSIPTQNLVCKEITQSDLTQNRNFVSSSISKNNSALKMWDIETWIDRISSIPIASFKKMIDSVLLGAPTEEINILSDESYEIYKNLLILIFVGKLKNIIHSSLRSYKDILNGKLAYSESVFYRIEKSVSVTGKIVQNFYIPNSNKFDLVNFVDTQVKYDKEYVYKIFVYQMVIGNVYNHKLISLTDETATVSVENNPSIKIIEVLYSQFNARILDNPPLAPEIDVISYRGVNDKILLNMNSSFGDKKEPYVALQPDDLIFFQKVLNVQDSSNGEIYFRSDDIASVFEIYRIDFKPFSYEDFKNKRIAKVFTDISTLSLQAASAASFVDSIKPNKKYYYTFRAIDVHQHISNPGPVFEVEIVDLNGTIYSLINVVDFDNINEHKVYSKQFRRFLQIAPAFGQKLINEQKSGLIVNGEPVDTVLNKEQIFLGIEDQSVWKKTFKIRLTSKNTGKKIDFNIDFDSEHVKKV